MLLGNSVFQKQGMKVLRNAAAFSRPGDYDGDHSIHRSAASELLSVGTALIGDFTQYLAFFQFGFVFNDVLEENCAFFRQISAGVAELIAGFFTL